MEYADIHISFAKDILECADHCSRFNQQASSVFCTAASLDIGNTGPANEGFTCWLKQNATGLIAYNGTTNGSGVTTTAIHTAQLISALPAVAVFPFQTILMQQVTSSGLSRGQIAGIVIGSLGAAVLFLSGGFGIGRWWTMKQIIRPPEMPLQPY
jgi:hypothetical protein